jgi:hypothetical protein
MEDEMTTILPTNNPAWGFWGTMHEHAEAAWPLAMTAVAEATGCPATAVRDFLDSRYGRHFADEIANGLFRGLDLANAIDAAVTSWMAWTISRTTSRQTGIPRGLPYLTGFVTHHEILAEREEE